MPERWRDELGRLRTLQPSQDLWEKVGEHKEHPKPVPSRGHGRVLAALLAFAVFAVSGLGAWWSLSRVGRVNGHHSTVSPSPGPTAPFVFRGTLIVTGRPVGTNQGHHLYVVTQDGQDAADITITRVNVTTQPADPEFGEPPQNGYYITAHVTVKIKDDAAAKFEAAFAKARTATRKEKGNKAYNLNRSTKVANEYVVYAGTFSRDLMDALEGT